MPLSGNRSFRLSRLVSGPTFSAQQPLTFQPRAPVFLAPSAASPSLCTDLEDWRLGPSWRLGGRESTCQCRTHGFKPRSGKTHKPWDSLGPQLPSLCAWGLCSAGGAIQGEACARHGGQPRSPRPSEGRTPRRGPHAATRAQLVPKSILNPGAKRLRGRDVCSWGPDSFLPGSVTVPLPRVGEAAWGAQTRAWGPAWHGEAV